MVEKTFLIGAEDYANDIEKLSQDFIKRDDIDILNPSGVSMSEDALSEYLRQADKILRYYSPTRTKNVYQTNIVNAFGISASVRDLFSTDNNIPPHALEVQRWEGKGKHIYAGLASHILSPAVGKKVILCVPHARVQEMSPRGAFQVHVWSSPDLGLSAVTTTPSVIYGHNVSCRDYGYRASHEPEESIIITDNGNDIAQVCSNALYIFHDAVECNDEESHAIFTKILLQAAEIIKNTDFNKLQEARQERLREENRAAAREFAARSIPRQENRNKIKVESVKGQISSHETELYAKRRELANLEQGLNKEDAVQSFYDDFDKLQNGFAGIQSATFSEDCIKVITSPVVSVDRRSGLIYDLGTLVMTINFNHAGITVKHNGAEHGIRVPHTDSCGTVCRGTMHDEMSSYIANYEVLTIFSLLISFFEKGVDTMDDWGKRLLKYPVIGQPVDTKV